MIKKTSILILFCLIAIAAFAQNYRTRIMDFENPGSRRIRKTENGNHWYYRSLPEKTMTLNSKGVERIQIRSFSIENLRKPQIFILIGKERTSFELKLAERLNGYYIYEDIEFDVPAGTGKVEVLCYQRSIYMRAYEMEEIKPKIKPVRVPNRQVHAHAGMIDLNHNSSSSEYYTFNPAQAFRFTHNNAKNGVLYVRARLTDRSLPKFSLWHNGRKVDDYEFSLARSTKYSAQGIRYLSIGMKLDLPENADSSEYELRADSDHLFLARPVILLNR
jgi:hypothetical protein